MSLYSEETNAIYNEDYMQLIMQIDDANYDQTHLKYHIDIVKNNSEIALKNKIALENGNRVHGYFIISNIQTGCGKIIYGTCSVENTNIDIKIINVYPTSYNKDSYRYLLLPLTNCTYYIQNNIACDIKIINSIENIMSDISNVFTQRRFSGVLNEWNENTKTGIVKFSYGFTIYTCFIHGRQIKKKIDDKYEQYTDMINVPLDINFKIAENKYKKGKYMCVSASFD